MKHKSWIVSSGLLWMLVGLWLSWKGIIYITEGIKTPESGRTTISSYFANPQHGATLLVTVALLIGFVKGRFILSKTAHRVCRRIMGLPLPIHFQQVYGASYLLLIAGMMCLGMALRFVPIPLEFKGVIDLAIGSALFNGSMFYFREAQAIPSTSN